MLTAAGLGVGPDGEGRVFIAEDGRVAHFGPPEAESAAAAWIECPPGSIEPGRINAHTHLYSGLAPLGIPQPEEEPESFLQILERIWWRLDRALGPESLRAAARLYVAEALLAGTTTLIDHHESPEFIDGSLDVLADACHELGMRAILCFGATERNGGRDEARRGLAECRRFLESNQRPLVRGVVGLHASFTVSDDTIREAAELCRELRTVLHLHVAEDPIDIEDARARGYSDPLERLLRLEALPPGSILAHGVHLQAEQVRTAAKHGVWFVQNPRSNRGNRVGYPQALGESRRVALGTDGYPARMRQEAAALLQEAFAHREDRELAERRIDAGWELAEELFELPFAPLRSGAAADMAVFQHREDESPGLVVVGGRVVVQDGELQTADLDRIRAEAEEVAPQLWERMRAL